MNWSTFWTYVSIVSIGIICIAFAYIVISDIIKGIYNNYYLHYDSFDEYVEVVEKKYSDAFVIRDYYVPGRFQVHLSYEEKVYILDSKKLFETVRKGDKIMAKIYIGRNKNEEPKNTYIQIGNANSS